VVAVSLHNERDAILGGGSSEAQRMCADLASTWAAFARTGDPNNSRIPHWPHFDSARRATLIFEPGSYVAEDPHGALREFWLRMPAAPSVLG
jgi:para-nitrobenzyl esterase